MQVIVVIILIVVGLVIFLIAISSLVSVLGGSQFVRTPADLYSSITKLANLSPGERFVELGSGDGGLLKFIAENTGAKAHGIELSPWLYLRTLALASSRPDISVELTNFYRADLSQADCIYCYLLPRVMSKLAAKFDRELKPGTTVVSYAFEIPGKKPIQVLPRVNKFSNLYLYRY